MTLNANARLSKVPGVADAPDGAQDLADDFEPSEPSETEEDPNLPATDDGGDPFPVRASGPLSKKG